jgi:deoxycytidylate deaminase
MLINSGIEKVFYLDGYPDDLSLKMIDESSIHIEKVDFEKHENSTPVRNAPGVSRTKTQAKRKAQKGPRK